MDATEQAAPMSESLLARVAALEVALMAERAALAESRALVEQLTEERDHLRTSHDRLRQELELLRRRIFIAKAERVDSTQLELEFAQKLSALDALSGRLGEQPMSTDTGTGASVGGDGKSSGKKKPKGRRDLRQANIPEERVEITDPVFDELVLKGKAERIGFEESYKLGWQRGGHRRLVIARAKYRVLNAQKESTVATVPMPDETFPRLLAAPSMLAHIIAEKHLQGLPLYRLEDRYSREGAPIDRGTMCRWLEDAGATAGSTVIDAAKKEALASAFCLATDATGVAVQPIPREDKKRQPCRRAHFFVQIADHDHVFFEFTPRETSAAVAEMFKGFGGYVQADAKSVYDILFRPPDGENGVEDRRLEVGCWVHGRRGLWEAAVVLKSEVAREGLFRIKRIYDADRNWRGKPPDEIKRLRNIHVRPLVEAFFAWVAVEYEKVRAVRGLLRSGAFGYLSRHKDALMRFLDDGRWAIACFSWVMRSKPAASRGTTGLVVQCISGRL